MAQNDHVFFLDGQHTDPIDELTKQIKKLEKKIDHILLQSGSQDTKILHIRDPLDRNLQLCDLAVKILSLFV